MKAFFRAQSSPWRRGVEIYIGSTDHQTRVKDIVLERVEPYVTQEPSFTMDNEQAQTLMDDLWNSGIRPTEGAGTAGSMRAVERHLEDMRTLVFKSPLLSGPPP